MKNKISIYYPFVINEIKRNITYRTRFYFGILSKLLGVCITFFLWIAIYKNSGANKISGFTEIDMVLYIIVGYIVSNTVFVSISYEIGTNIIDGSIANSLIKPIDYRLSLISKAFGRMIFQFFVPSVFFIVGILSFQLFYFENKQYKIINLLFFILSMLCSFFIYVLFDFCFGMIAFFTTYIFGLQMVKSAVLSFLTGELIPLSFFPAVFQKVFDFLPFSSMVYTPVMIYLGKYSGSELMFVLARQVIWIVILFALGSLIWKKVTKRLVVLGG